MTPVLTLELVKKLAAEQGYRFEVDTDGTERMIRPDGTVALVARPPKKKDP
jgi:hypothetical protein